MNLQWCHLYIYSFFFPTISQPRLLWLNDVNWHRTSNDDADANEMNACCQFFLQNTILAHEEHGYRTTEACMLYQLTCCYASKAKTTNRTREGVNWTVVCMDDGFIWHVLWLSLSIAWLMCAHIKWLWEWAKVRTFIKLVTLSAVVICEKKDERHLLNEKLIRIN